VKTVDHESRGQEGKGARGQRTKGREQQRVESGEPRTEDREWRGLCERIVSVLGQERAGMVVRFLPVRQRIVMHWYVMLL
jgi:hypothetical protein